MPRISLYYGIAIYMYYQDHAPPHFHAIYGEHEATIVIRNGTVLDGALSKRALKLVKEWTKLHRDELKENWELARAKVKLNKVAPLE